MIYSFDTAWYPPLPLLETVSADYPALMFQLAFTQPISHGQQQFVFQGGKAIEVE